MPNNSASRPRAYLAAPLFSEAELSHNVKLTEVLQQEFDVYLPQRDGGRVVELVAGGMSKDEAYRFVFACDLQALRAADVLVIVLDGRTVDEGAVFELGVAYAAGKVCIGYQSDSRRLHPLGNNPMIDCALQACVSSQRQLADWGKSFATRFDVTHGPSLSILSDDLTQ